MRIIGLTAEYNPFHRGHAWQLARIRDRFGPDAAVVTVLSGCFVQRGEPALFDARARAEAAVRCGTDLVLELPLPWAISSAQGFARGAVTMLENLGCVEELVFGSESRDLAELQAVRRLLEDPMLKPLLHEALSAGLGFAAARQQAAERLAGGEVPQLRRRNDILALSYLEALEELDSPIRPCPMPRCEEYAPASALREREDYLTFLPDEAAEVFRRETAAGRGPVRPADLEIPILAVLRSLPAERWETLPDGGEGLENRIRQAALEAGSWEEFTRLGVTKRYPAARIRRIALAAFLGVTREASAGSPPYLRVLALNQRGREVLNRASPRLPVLIKAAKGKGDPILELEQRAAGLYALAFRNPEERRGDRGWKQSPFVME